jgi:hypothetical protein
MKNIFILASLISVSCGPVRSEPCQVRTGDGATQAMVQDALDLAQQNGHDLRCEMFKDTLFLGRQQSFYSESSGKLVNGLYKPAENTIIFNLWVAGSLCHEMGHRKDDYEGTRPMHLDDPHWDWTARGYARLESVCRYLPLRGNLPAPPGFMP